jgi:hypothetical protein
MSEFEGQRREMERIGKEVGIKVEDLKRMEGENVRL